MICDSWAEKDSRIKVIHQENRGLSSARNNGVEIAKGEFIGFIDSDDYVLPEYFETLYKLISDNNADMSICYYEHVDESGEIIIPITKCPFKSGVFTSEEILSIKSFPNAAWCKLYKSWLCRKKKFPEGRFFEDGFVMFRFIDSCNKIAVTDEKLYKYIKRSDSITGEVAHSFNSKKLNDNIDVNFERYKFFKSRNMFKSAEQELINMYFCVIARMRHRYYFENFGIINHALLTVIQKTLTEEKFHSIKFFAHLILYISWRILKKIMRITKKVFSNYLHIYIM